MTELNTQQIIKYTMTSEINELQQVLQFLILSALMNKLTKIK